MLVISLSGVNRGFWSHLGCPGQNVTIFSCQRIYWDAPRQSSSISARTALPGKRPWKRGCPSRGKNKKPGLLFPFWVISFRGEIELETRPERSLLVGLFQFFLQASTTSSDGCSRGGGSNMPSQLRLALTLTRHIMCFFSYLVCALMSQSWWITQVPDFTEGFQL